ncbi:hypothetical protein [Brevibacillus migulae]|uniref:hypothetical protein n=1 Tax=Brevibacillus migulae TaxID=1644114 RepID=UPI00106E2353|nr:hypothetical protein [Brevibacillus migulae]
MSYYFSVCTTEMYQQKHILFLLENYKDLGLPYPFPLTLSLIASPLLMERESFLCFNEDHEVIGAFSYIFGTGEMQYEDREVVQIQAVFIREEYRGSRVFLMALQFMTEYITFMGEDVREVRFWASDDVLLRRLFSKIADRVSSVDSAFGPLDEYHAPFAAWQAYASRFRHEPFFPS